MAFLLHDKRGVGLALARLVAGVRLVDHIDTTLAADDLAIGVTLLQRLEGGGDFHGLEGRMETAGRPTKVAAA
jgi:hypothetical protein